MYSSAPMCSLPSLPPFSPLPGLLWGQEMYHNYLWLLSTSTPPLTSCRRKENSRERRREGSKTRKFSQLKNIFHVYQYLSISVATAAAATAAKSLQSCPTLCDPIDCSPPGSPVPGILQARTLEWVAISFSNAWKWKVKVKSLSRIRLFVIPWTAAYQAPPSMGFSRQEYWSALPWTSATACFSDLFALNFALFGPSSIQLPE